MSHFVELKFAHSWVPVCVSPACLSLGKGVWAVLSVTHITVSHLRPTLYAEELRSAHLSNSKMQQVPVINEGPAVVNSGQPCKINI